MLDIRFIRENPDLVQEAARNKGYDVDIKELLSADESRRELMSKADELRSRRNEISSQMKGGKPSPELVEAGKKLKTELAEVEDHLRVVDDEYTRLLKSVPNMPAHDVPVSRDEADNVIVKTVGGIPSFDFEPKNHYEIAQERGWLDKERAAKVAGARFAYVMGDLVKLQLAVEQFVIDTLTDQAKIKEIAMAAGLESISTKPFTPVLPPLMIKTEAYDQMDRLEPQDDRYKIEGEELWLQGSAEHVLGSMHAGEIFEEAELPVRYLGLATSFRKEAGTYGKDMEGLIRMHQFDKLEMESFTTADTSFDEHLLFIAIQEYLLSTLKLPYHVLQKVTGDIGKPDARGIDMEVWLPGQGKYRETHTADYMTDYQARRLNTRVRRHSGVELVHTNDATAFALGRCMVAIIENYQRVDGSITIPDALRAYLGGREIL
ncbi:serine--tRNA ligase [Candidatus Saccharibacteria bacterium]|nr:serine--tRNA ligase [Candidatus Saccharibacteria bacterium]